MPKSSVTFLEQTFGNTNDIPDPGDAPAVAAVLYGWDGVSQFRQVQVDTTGILKQSGSPYTILSARYNGNPGNVETQVIAGVTAKTIFVCGYSLSTDTAMLLRLHHQATASSTNNLGGGYFPANGGERADFIMPMPGLAVNQPVTILPAAAGNVEVTVYYYTV